MDDYATAIPRKGMSPVRVYRVDGVTYRAKARFGWSEFPGQSPYFAVTCDTEESAGADHASIAEHFPTLAHLTRWHLFSYDTGPTHYVANTTYHASDRDHWGKRKGEPTSWETWLYVDNSPIGHKFPDKVAQHLLSLKGSDLSVFEVEHKNDPATFSPNYYVAETRDDSMAWHGCPFHSLRQAEEWRRALSLYSVRADQVPTRFSEGKVPDIEAARACAAWPEATLAQLSDPEALMARLPGLLAQMREEIEAAGIGWPTDWLAL